MWSRKRPLEMDRTELYRRIYVEEPPNTDELAKAILDIREERERWLARGKSLSAYCGRLFSAEAGASGYERVFARAMKGKIREGRP